MIIRHSGRNGGFGALVRRNRRRFTLSIITLVVLASVLPVVARKILNHGATAEDTEPADFVRKRADWYFRPRASARGHVPNDLRLRAIAERDERIRREGTYASQHFWRDSSSISDSQWTPIGPQPLPNEGHFGTTSGRVNAVAVDPCDSSNNTLYIGAADGGMWRTNDGGSRWEPLTDGQPSLSSGSIALIPSGSNCNATTIFYGTGEENFSGDTLYGAGVLKSTNAGGTWTPDSTFNSGQPQGQHSAAPYIGSISVKPGSNAVLLAGLEGTETITSGIWLSTDGGVHWALHNPTNPSWDIATGIVFDPNDATGNTAFAAMGDPSGDAALIKAGHCSASPCNGIFKSTNGGLTWIRLTGLDTAINASGIYSDSNYGRISIAVSSPLPGIVGNPANTEIFVAIADSSTNSKRFLAFAKSVDGGTTWSILTGEPFCNRGTDAGQCFYDMALAVQPGNPQTLFAGGAAGAITSTSDLDPTLLRSTDGGNTWADVSASNIGGPNSQIHVDHHAVTFSSDGAKIYVGNDGGIWSSTDAMTAAAGSEHWTELNDTLQTMQFYPGMSPHPSNANIIFGGTQDNGSLIYNGTPSWTWINGTCGDGSSTAIGPVSANNFTVFLACDTDNGHKIWLSTDSGSTFAPVDSGINFSQAVDFIPPFIEDPTIPQNVYFGTNRLWQSETQGTIWIAMAGNSDLTKGNGDYLTAMTVAPSDSNTIYVGSEKGSVRVTTNALSDVTATFSPPATGLPNRKVTSIAIDTASAATAYVCFSGYSGFGDMSGHVFKTSNTGASWTSIDGDLPNVPVNDFIIDPEDPQDTFYVGTDIGVFVTSNGGAHWDALASGLPNDQVLSLKLQPSNRLLIAGTHGRGAWEIALGTIGTTAPIITSLNPPSVTAGAAQLALTLYGANFATTSTINFSGVPLETATSGQPNSLATTVPSTLLATAGSFPITITGGSQNSNIVNFTVIPQPDFKFGTITSSPSNATVAPGGSVTYTIPVIAVGDFTSSVALTCGVGLPGNTSCNTASATISSSATLTISTAANSAVPDAPTVDFYPPTLFARALPSSVLIILALFAVFLCTGLRRRPFVLGVRLAAAVVILLLAGCPGHPGTRPGSYSVTISGTSGSRMHTTAVSITVN